MLPKSSKEYLKTTAEKLNCDVELVDAVVTYYYKEVRKCLTEMRGPNIKINKLGNFKVKPNELPKLINKYKKHLDILEPETFNKMSIKREIHFKLDRVQKLYRMLNSEMFRKQKFKQRKNENKLK